MFKAKQIADWILSQVNVEAGDNMSPLKLQKLLYYCQAWHLAIYDKPLFNEDIEAWAHGPVVPSQYRRFSSVMMNEIIDIRNLDITVPSLPQETEELLKEIMDIYGEHTAFYLEQLTHSERPWKETRGDLASYAASNRKIPHNLMKEYYSSINNV